MTTEPKAGPELDAMIAEKVMGVEAMHPLRCIVPSEGWMIVFRKPGEQDRTVIYHDGKYHPWSPSTDISAAWQVIEKMRESGSQVLMDSDYDGEKKWMANFTADKRKRAYATTAPLAICLAALKATGALP